MANMHGKWNIMGVAQPATSVLMSLDFVRAEARSESTNLVRGMNCDLEDYYIVLIFNVRLLTTEMTSLIWTLIMVVVGIIVLIILLRVLFGLI
jgi:hypothetical protein